ncbi:hypothetical protein Tco_0039674 [Tanacetum coccineum]
MNEHETKADKNVKEDPMATDFGIISLGYVNLDQVMKEAESNINTKDTTTLVSAAPSTEVPSVSDSKPVPHRDVLVVVVVDSLVVVVVDSLVVVVEFLIYQPLILLKNINPHSYL